MNLSGLSWRLPSRGVRRGIRADSPRQLSRYAAGACALTLLLFTLAACGDGGEIVPPTPLYGNTPIEYPLDLWDADVEGETLLRVRVTEMGEVDSVEVLEPSGYPAFDSAAVNGARLLRYSPATRKERRISVWAKVPVQFTKGGP